MLVLKGHLATKPVRSLAFAPDGTRLASSARDYTVRLWDLATGKGEVVVGRGCYTVAFAPDGKALAVGKSSSVVVLDLATRGAREIKVEYDGDALAVGYSPDGRLLVGVGRSVRVWLADTHE